MTQKIWITTLGCPKNEVDSENLKYIMRQAGYGQADEPDEADIVLINTCGFIADAKEESVAAIFEAVQLKKNRPEMKLIVTGCLAQRYGAQLEAEIPEIDCIAGVTAQAELPDLIAAGKKTAFRDIDAVMPETGRVLDGAPYSAYIKISEGCDKRCTYCIIPKIRGRQRSRRMEDIEAEARMLAASGVRDLIVIAQDIGEYGTDLYGARMLAGLLRRLEKIEGIRWIRLMYLYPETVSDELIGVIAQSGKILHYLDVPFQHIDDAVLRAMNRRTCASDIHALIEKLRARMPDVAIRSTFIVGFPGETQAQFKALCDFVAQAGLIRVGAFKYSREEDTPAALMKGQVASTVKQKRYDALMRIQMDVSEKMMKNFIGRVLEVLIEEETGENTYTARSYLDAPEIDGAVYVHSDKKLQAGDIVPVCIEARMHTI
jgi:ribosomal protein S12 methylthiotransferase